VTVFAVSQSSGDAVLETHPESPVAPNATPTRTRRRCTLGWRAGVALIAAAMVMLGSSAAFASVSKPTIMVKIAGSGTVQLTTKFHGRTGHYTLTRNRTIGIAAGTRVTLAERPLNGAGFGGWSGGGCTPARTSCALTVHKTTAIGVRFVATPTKISIVCATVTYTGSPQTPCAARVTGSGGLNAAARVVYIGNHTNAGTVTVTASFGGNVSHLRSTASTSFVIAKASAGVRPVISNLPANGTYNGSFTPTVTTSGDGATSVTSNSPSVCTVNGTGIVAYIGVGTCSLTADVAAGINYLSASGSPQTLSVGQASQAITGLASAPGAVGTTYNLSTAGITGGGSGVPIVYSVDPATTNAACALGVDGVTLSFNYIGSCVIDANQAGTTDYAAAPQVQATIAVMLTQTLAFTTAAPSGAVVAGAAYAPGVSGGGSGNPITLTIDPTSSSVCTISAGVVSFTSVGTCTIDANQLGSSGYFAATQIQQAFAVGKGTLYVVPAAVTVTAGSPVPAVTYSLYTGSATGGTLVTPTLQTPPTCGSAYTTTLAAGSYPGLVSCGGPPSYFGTAGSDPNYNFDYSTTANLIVNP